MTAFPQSTGLVPAKHDGFFKSISSDHYRMSTDPDGASLVALVVVDDALAADVPDEDAPPRGAYTLHWDDAGVVHAFAYDSLEKAVEDVRPWLEDGDDPFDEADYEPVLTVLDTYKPAQVVTTATARIEVTGAPATHTQVVDAGLAALHESKSSLFGYGIRNLHIENYTDDGDLKPGVYTVYANRD